MNFELEICLDGIKPPIRRRVIVASSISLDELHSVIQGAMGWEDRHLHMFEIAGQCYEVPENDDVGPEQGYLDERNFTLGEVVEHNADFLYIYDFGDSWRHVIRSKHINTAAEVLPSCLMGERACPPEDCGGAYRYSDFIERLTNVDHPDHHETKNWAPTFEPEVFSVSQANSMIAALCAWCKERKAHLQTQN